MEAWLHEVNEVSLFLGFLALLIGAAQFGVVVARRTRHEDDDGAPSVSAAQGAVFGLLALLLAFTFSLAMARFETRKEMLRDEANAIGTTYLRARLLPEPMRSRVTEQLRTYVETRFELKAVSFSPERLRAVHLRSSALQDRIWDEAVAAAETDPKSQMIALFVASLNDMIDMHGNQMAAIRNHVPAWLFILLFVVAAVSLGVMGYGSGPNSAQAFALNTLVALVISAVTLLVFDLHRPVRGLITVGMSSMVDLREGMQPGAR